jgi:AraC-like DNA-binding protein
MDWLKKNEFLQNTIQDFFESNGKHLVIHNYLDVDIDFYTQFTQLLQKEKNHQTKLETIELAKRFVKLFSFCLDGQNLSPEHFLLQDNDWEKILSVERFLKENLFKGFPGIELISKKVNISPTKLKTNFKIVHQKTIYAYFQEHQMDIADQLLRERTYKVKEVAALLCYENASKFTAVFKKYYGILPSDLSREPEMITINEGTFIK